MEKKRFKTVDEYLASLPRNARSRSQQLRRAIRQAVPQAEEVISYNMPLFKYHGRLVYFAAYKNHIGFYPFTSAIRAFKGKLTKYKTSTGTIQFSIDGDIPVTLVKTIVRFRVKENLEKERAKAKKKK